jgi:hypothetical protein
MNPAMMSSKSVDRIVAPIKPQDNGPAVANLQQAMLFIVEKKRVAQLSVPSSMSTNRGCLLKWHNSFSVK